MQVINTQDMWKRWLPVFLQYLPRYDAYLELASCPRTELMFARQGYSLFQRCRADMPLAAAKAVQHDTSVVELTKLIRRGEQIVVSVDLERCYARSIKMPPNALNRIEQILDLDIARMMPFARESIFSGWFNQGAAETGPSLNIRHIVIQKKIVADALQAIQEAGAKAIGIIVRDAGGPALPMALGPDGDPFRIVAMKSWRRIAAISLAALVGSAVAFASIVLLRQSSIQADILIHSQAFENDVAEVRDKLSVIKANSAEVSALLLRKSTRTEHLEILEELSRTVPDGAFLDGIGIESNRITIDGGAKAPEELIAILEASKLFHNVAFSSPIFKNPGDERSHFSIRLELEPPASELQN
jgi:general secretion pathway protein L